MKSLGRMALCLDVDGVLRDLGWRAGLEDFIRWAWGTFDLVLLLTPLREFVYESWPGTAGTGWPCPPSLAWEASRTEPLPGLLRSGMRVFVVTAAATPSEAQWCRRHDDLVHLVDCRGGMALLADVRERIYRTMQEARKGGGTER